jgi:4-amino-4-deoxy-L-arabinose transferase-like glycosyltransferase
MARHRFPAWTVLLLAFGLRVWALAEHNIWWDEGLAVWAARQPAVEIIRWTAHDVHPPLYFLLLRGWWSVAGEGEFVLRFPSALAGTLLVAAGYGLGRALGGRRSGLMVALLLALSRFVVSWSQEMRMYILAAALACGALWAAVSLWRTGRWSAWIAYVLAVAAGLWTLYLTISVPLAANLAFLVAWARSGRRRRQLLQWISAQLAAVALFVPWLIYALPRMPTWSTAEPFTPRFFLELYSTLLAVGVPLDLSRYRPMTAVVWMVLAAALVALWRMQRRPEQSAGMVMLLLGLVFPAAVVYGVSLPIHLYYAPRLAPRYLLPLAVCFYGLLGWGLSAILSRRRRAGAVLLLAVVAIAAYSLAPVYRHRARRDDYASLVDTLEAHRRPGDVVVLHNDKDWPILAAHYDGDWQGVPYGRPVTDEFAAGLLDPLWQGAEGLWLVTTPDAQRTDPEGAMGRWLASRSARAATWSYGESTLTLYARTGERAETLYDLAPGAAVPENLQVALGSSARLAGASLPFDRHLTGDTLHLALYWLTLPAEPVTLVLAGPVRQTRAIETPLAAGSGPTRQQIDVSLTADLTPGRYRLLLQSGAQDEVAAGEFTLVGRGPKGTAELPGEAVRVDYGLGDSIRLVGYDLPRRTAAPGSAVELTLYWEASEAVTERYKVFTHLVGPTYNAATGNFLWGQQDNEPAGDQAPTTVWAPGVIVEDRYQIPVAADAPPGVYQLEVGLYGLNDGVRLPVTSRGQAVGDAVWLGEVDIGGR